MRLAGAFSNAIRISLSPIRKLPFLRAYRMRNRLSHGYDTIDWSVLWDTATVYVPPLISFVRKQWMKEGG